MKFQFLFTVLLLSAWMTGCKKNKITDSMKPVITVAEPTPGDTIVASVDPEVHVEFTVNDQQGLHTLAITLVRNATDTLLTVQPAVMDKTVYPFHTHLNLTGVTGLQTLQLFLRAENHSSLVSTQEITFYAQP